MTRVRTKGRSDSARNEEGSPESKGFRCVGSVGLKSSEGKGKGYPESSGEQDRDGDGNSDVGRLSVSVVVDVDPAKIGAGSNQRLWP
jgi:hypothetical protein